MPFVLGCYSTSLLQEPETLPARAVRAAIGLTWDPERIVLGVPVPALGLRYAVIDRLEVRTKVSPVGAELGVDAEVVRNQSMRVNLLPHVVAYQSVFEDDDDYVDEDPRGSPHNFRALAAPVIVSLRASDTVEWFVGPDQHVGLRDSKAFYAAGAHAGLVIHYGDHATQVFECTLLVGIAGQQPVAGKPYTYPNGSQSFLTVGDVSGQCGLGLSFGSSRSPQPH